MIFRILAALVLVVLVASSLLSGGSQRQSFAPTTVDRSSAEPGYSARKATLVETGPDGRPIYTMNAEVIRQRPGDGVDFEQVQMSFRDQADNLWTARADRGQLGQDTSKVNLAGNVHVDGLLPHSTASADLATEQLAVDTQADIVSTAEPVTLNWAGRELKSNGLVATLNERRVLLESNVHGSFLP